MFNTSILMQYLLATIQRSVIVVVYLQHHPCQNPHSVYLVFGLQTGISWYGIIRDMSGVGSSDRLDICSTITFSLVTYKQGYRDFLWYPYNQSMPSPGHTTSSPQLALKLGSRHVTFSTRQEQLCCVWGSLICLIGAQPFYFHSIPTNNNL